MSSLNDLIRDTILAEPKPRDFPKPLSRTEFNKLIRLIESNQPIPLEEIDPLHLVEAFFVIEMMEHFMDANTELFPEEYPQTISTKKSETDPQP